MVMITTDITNRAVAGTANLSRSRRSGELTRLRPQHMTSFRSRIQFQLSFSNNILALGWPLQLNSVLARQIWAATWETSTPDALLIPCRGNQAPRVPTNNPTGSPIRARWGSRKYRDAPCLREPNSIDFKPRNAANAPSSRPIRKRNGPMKTWPTVAGTAEAHRQRGRRLLEKRCLNAWQTPSRDWRGSSMPNSSPPRRAERAPDPDAMDLYFQGTAWLHKVLGASVPDLRSSGHPVTQRDCSSKRSSAHLAGEPSNSAVRAAIGAAIPS